MVSPDDPLAELYCMSVYLTEFKDRTWLPPGSVKTLRVIEGIPAPGGRGGERFAQASRFPQLSARRILAEVPVKPDGSFHLTVPASTPIQLQLLDDRGLALRSCGWIWARNHQAQGCIGCHEDPELTPPNRVPDALEGRRRRGGRSHRAPHHRRFRRDDRADRRVEMRSLPPRRDEQRRTLPATSPATAAR